MKITIQQGFQLYERHFCGIISIKGQTVKHILSLDISRRCLFSSSTMSSYKCGGMKENPVIKCCIVVKIIKYKKI